MVSKAVNVAEKVVNKDYMGAITEIAPDNKYLQTAANAYDKIKNKDYMGLAQEVTGLVGETNPEIAEKLESAVNVYSAVKDKNYGAAIAAIDPNNAMLQKVGSVTDAALKGDYGTAIAAIDPNNPTLQKVGSATKAALSGNYEDAITSMFPDDPKIKTALAAYEKYKNKDYAGIAVEVGGLIQPGTDLEYVANAVEAISKKDYATAANLLGTKFNVDSNILTAVEKGINKDYEGAALLVANATGNNNLKTVISQAIDAKSTIAKLKSGEIDLAQAAQNMGIENELINKSITAYDQIKNEGNVAGVIKTITGKDVDPKMAVVLNKAVNGDKFDVGELASAVGVNIPAKDIITAVENRDMEKLIDILPAENLKEQLGEENLEKVKNLMKGDVSLNNIEALVGGNIDPEFASKLDAIKEFENSHDPNALIKQLIGEEASQEALNKVDSMINLAQEAEGNVDKIKEMISSAKEQAEKIQQEVKETDYSELVVNILPADDLSFDIEDKLISTLDSTKDALNVIDTITE
jgi:hypothetical protein